MGRRELATRVARRGGDFIDEAPRDVVFAQLTRPSRPLTVIDGAKQRLARGGVATRDWDGAARLSVRSVDQLREARATAKADAAQ